MPPLANKAQAMRAILLASDIQTDRGNLHVDGSLM
jgi:hypothetical protein